MAATSDAVPAANDIELEWSSQHLKLRDATEDWTGKTNQIERRKLQNRLNQRARRMRARGQDKASTETRSNRSGPISTTNEDNSSASPPNNGTVVSTASPKMLCLTTSPRVQELMRRFAEHAYASYVQGTPALSHLTLLVRYNVASAFLRNADLLGVTDEFSKWEGISPFVKRGPASARTTLQDSTNWPANLLPTEVQCSIEHHPWLDVFPWPKVRDNMVQAFEQLSLDGEDELCHDVSEYEGHETGPMLVVWGDAWDPHCWEITPDFLKKWGWLLSGSEESLEATNYWRVKRGERPISRRQLHEAIQLSMPLQLRNAVGL